MYIRNNESLCIHSIEALGIFSDMMGVKIDLTGRQELGTVVLAGLGLLTILMPLQAGINVKKTMTGGKMKSVLTSSSHICLTCTLLLSLV